MPLIPRDSLYMFNAVPHKNIKPLESWTARSARSGVQFQCFMTEVVLPEDEPLQALLRRSNGYAIGIKDNRNPEKLYDAMSGAAAVLKNDDIAILKSDTANFYFIIGDLIRLQDAIVNGEKKIPHIITRLQNKEIDVFSDLRNAINGIHTTREQHAK